MKNATVIGKAGKFNICFRPETLSNHAGAVLLQEMVERGHLPQMIDDELQVKTRARGYRESDHVLALSWNLILGGSCLSDVEALRGDPGTLRLLGVQALPAPWTLGEYLRKFGLGDICDLQRLLRRAAAVYRPFQSWPGCTIDLDASIYAQASTEKQGSRKAYNGEVGYHPLFAFCAETTELLYSHLLAGNRYPTTKAIWLMEQVLRTIPEGAKRQLRADSAFYTWPLIDWLEEHDFTWAITADLTKALRQQVEKLAEQAWKKNKFYRGAQVAEFCFRPVHRPKAYRYVVKRERRTDKKGQAYWSYHVIMTNDTRRRAAKVVKWYMGRCTVENQIKEHKHGFSLEKLPTKQFHANWAYLLIGQLAYNLVVWFKRLVLPERYHTATIKTLRHHLFNLAGKIVQTGRQFFLAISEEYRYQDVWRFALKQLDKLAT